MMNAEEVKLLLERLSEGVAQKRVALRCDCHNLETVYITLNETEEVCITDDHRTFQYLSRGTDSTYLPAECLDLAIVQRVCEDLAVTFKSAPEDGFPSIEYIPDSGESILSAIDRVAEAVDQVFEIAIQPELKQEAQQGGDGDAEEAV